MTIPAYSNLNEFIYNGKDIILTYHNFSFIEIFEDIKFPVYNVVQDYIEELKDESITIQLTDDEYMRYKYKPRLLSNVVYGTTEFFYLILMLNGMASEKEFTKQTFKLLPKAKLQDTINRIYIAEKNNISKYNNSAINDYQKSE